MSDMNRFAQLPNAQKLDVYNKAHQFRQCNTPPRKLSQDDLCACIWYGELMMNHWKQNPPCSFEELQNFMDMHTWLINLKRERMEREFKQNPNTPLPLLIKSEWDISQQ